jgi:hypothetical protein
MAKRVKTVEHKEDTRSKATQDIEELAVLQQESEQQKLPDQTNPPMGIRDVF